ncbi:MAG: hypothetical protein AAF609_26070 [Cyanobacteria bacterium P01_C01_bin.120]
MIAIGATSAAGLASHLHGSLSSVQGADSEAIAASGALNVRSLRLGGRVSGFVVQ